LQPADPPDPSDEELDRLAALRPRGRRLPEELAELYGRIRDAAIVRTKVDPSMPPYGFERFEAYDAVIGGMGLVIKARDPQLDRMVAIKLWRQSGSEAQAALLAEARTLAKLSHPQVVTIHETGHWGDRVYFVMEWIEGMDGHTWMEQPRGWEDVRDVFVMAGDGLAAAHDVGIQHRDFKPANMLIGNDGRVVVADFGVADSLHAVAVGDEAGRIVGTPSYMAPERLRGGRGDARSDQFSFCVAMWRALYGQRPFAGETGEALLEAIERGELRETPGVYVPEWLSAVVRKGLAEDPEGRHRGMHELVDALLDEPTGGQRRADEPGEQVLDAPA
jgi:serine/threonine protein kinase